ncbi:MAG: hypothetical protein DMG81_11425 [Acidobacteria bacterium]|nr:MAG: hypothetical protein DMG81_11425 [Acidobacteriota bacterium]
MKKLGLAVMVCVMASAVAAGAQDKPRVFVQGKGSQDVTSSGSGGGGKHWGAWGSSSTIDSHDESMEISKDLQKNCTGVTVTLNQSNADYSILMNRESKKNRGLLRSNSQVQVANKAGDVLGTNATHTVGNAAKDACQMILADWQTHGPVNAQESQTPAAASPQAPPAVVPAVATQGQPSGARLQNATATPGNAQVQPATDPVVTSVTVSTAPDSVGEAARKQKQHQACLQLAKDNPSIVCK